MTDPDERSNLAGDPASAGLVGQFRQEVAARWDLAALDRAVRLSQRRRRAVAAALGIGTPDPVGLRAGLWRRSALHPQPHGPG